MKMQNVNIDLPENFLNEEVRAGYTVSPEMKRIWAVELDLLSEFIRVCEKYGLKYYADGGTLLGALRHQGYIPWDDDIDVTMMRADYDKLCAVAKDEFKDPYFFQTSSTDVDCHFHHAKLRNSRTAAVTECDLCKRYNQGIWIDILPLDNIPDSDEELARFSNQLWHAQEKLSLFRTYIYEFQAKRGQGCFNFLKHQIKHYYIKYFWSRIHPVESVCRQIEDMIVSYKNKPSHRIANISIIWFVIPKKLFWQRSWYEGERYADFEFLKLPIPSGSENMMEMQYGDWHKMVKGASCHKDKIFDTEKPFTEYIRVKRK